ncbi:MAG: hypothetical protein M1821_009161 [Bathelium mastoideum]|nr:MAG: hypothetical protein M1821_009161 [Bathelium mastoideum]
MSGHFSPQAAAQSYLPTPKPEGPKNLDGDWPEPGSQEGRPAMDHLSDDMAHLRLQADTHTSQHLKSVEEPAGSNAEIKLRTRTPVAPDVTSVPTDSDVDQTAQQSSCLTTKSSSKSVAPIAPSGAQSKPSRRHTAMFAGALTRSHIAPTLAKKDISSPKNSLQPRASHSGVQEQQYVKVSLPFQPSNPSPLALPFSIPYPNYTCFSSLPSIPQVQPAPSLNPCLSSLHPANFPTRSNCRPRKSEWRIDKNARYALSGSSQLQHQFPAREAGDKTTKKPRHRARKKDVKARAKAETTTSDVCARLSTTAPDLRQEPRPGMVNVRGAVDIKDAPLPLNSNNSLGSHRVTNRRPFSSLAITRTFEDMKLTKDTGFASECSPKDMKTFQQSPDLTVVDSIKKSHNLDTTIPRLPVPSPSAQYLAFARARSNRLDRPQRLLVIIDLNGTLLFRPDRRQPRDFIARPKVTEFFQYLFANHAVMVWSSARPPNVKSMCERLFTPDQAKQLVATWARDTLGLSSQQYNNKVQVYKRLDQVWRSTNFADPQGPQWSQANTLLIDDSLEKAKGEPFNAVQIEEFKGDLSERSKGRGVLEDVILFLEDAKWWDNVSSFVKNRGSLVVGQSKLQTSEKTACENREAVS